MPAQDTIGRELQNGMALHREGRLADAAKVYNRILKQNPDHFDALHLLGVIFYQIRLYEQAVTLISKAIAINAAFPDAHSNLGNALKDQRRLEEALMSYDTAIALRPDYAEAYYNRGVALQELGRLQDALGSYENAIALKPDYAEAYSNQGVALKDLKRFDEAVATLERAIVLKPEYAEAYSNRGVSLAELRRFEEAIADFDKAIMLKPRYAEAYLNRGNTLFEMKRFEDALANYEKAVELNPDNALAYTNTAGVLKRLQRHDEAACNYQIALRLEPQYPFVKGMLLHQKMICCNWSGVEDLISEIEADIAAGRPSAEPFGWQGVSKSPRSLQRCSEIFSETHYHYSATQLRAAPRSSEKIRVGYVSGEFRDQATSHLLVGVLERHDKTHIDIFIIDNGWDDQSEIRRRIDQCATEVVNIRRLDDQAAAAAVRSRNIDILVNLNGFFGEVRTAVFSQRPSPIQINYLGFPGTMGAPYIDYIIGDDIVIPKCHYDFYAEKVITMPHCYQANDDRKIISQRRFSRAELSLPETGFVFCCFNNTYKITPEIFDIWMRILRQVEGSVLWLLEKKSATRNLNHEAVLRGVEADRLIFAPPIGLADHLARHNLADLFLDTAPYNAHTTASDALWAGLPVLTQIGETFPGRVAASLLTAVGLPQLITQSPEAYEALAIQLATNPDELGSLREKLAGRRLTAPLFNTALFTRHLEAAYTAIVDRNYAGLPPDHLRVDH